MNDEAVGEHSKDDTRDHNVKEVLANRESDDSEDDASNWRRYEEQHTKLHNSYSATVEGLYNDQQRGAQLLIWDMKDSIVSLVAGMAGKIQGRPKHGDESRQVNPYSEQKSNLLINVVIF